MFDWFRKLCGKGTLRCRAYLYDGRTAIVKIKYIGDIDSINAYDLAEIKHKIYVEDGLRVKSLKVLGYTDDR